MHAETAALHGIDAAGATLIVVRLGLYGLVYSQPCAACAQTLEQAGIRQVLHS